MTPPMPAQDLPRGWQAGAERGPCRQIADYQAKPLSKSQNFLRQLSYELWCAFWGDTPGKLY